MLAERAREVALEATVRERLELIESALLRAAEADSPMVTEAAQHVIAAGGKRFRPLLVVLASQFGPADGPAGGAPVDDVVRAAMVVELTHVASLYHDDVMDEARLRRGSASANARWGNTVAILVGDFLFARASEEVAELGPDYVRLQSRTFARLVQGQIAETVGPQDADPLEHYLSVVADKTASLIATSALFGAKVAGAELSVQRALAAYAEEIGTVFQLSDDIIDVTSDETGKTPGHRPARRHPDPADAAVPALRRPDLTRRRPAAAAAGLRPPRGRRPGRGAGPAARPPVRRPGAGRGPASGRPGPFLPDRPPRRPRPRRSGRPLRLGGHPR